ncbi:MAG: redox-sensing transcriptional repressor Rex [Clostridiales Family XIII bacterium]|nr:redox-sensing transcriptional repressor Rex [Clostridiales Family XIII bacterium]
MKDYNRISPAVIKRLPRYKRYLSDLRKKGIERVSSGKLGELMGCTASQIRQDLNNFGGFGQQGYGYNVAALSEEIDGILGLAKNYKLVIIGVGNLGRAVHNYVSAYNKEYTIGAIFDVNPDIIGTNVGTHTILDVSQLPAHLSENKVDIGIITTTLDGAQEIANLLVNGGVGGIWNFAPLDLEVPEEIAITSVHISDSLQELTFYINNGNNL